MLTSMNANKENTNVSPRHVSINPDPTTAHQIQIQPESVTQETTNVTTMHNVSYLHLTAVTIVFVTPVSTVMVTPSGQEMTVFLIPWLWAQRERRDVTISMNVPLKHITVSQKRNCALILTLELANLNVFKSVLFCHVYKIFVQRDILAFKLAKIQEWLLFSFLLVEIVYFK